MAEVQNLECVPATVLVMTKAFQDSPEEGRMKIEHDNSS